jgi:3-hydroxyacyl-CoA dehydrogenase/enoyl-CoA hydratase/3-hydroxybutyryl-CoA epimerase
LQQLRDLDLPAQARVARELVDRPGAGDANFLDLAACLAGITPAWSGGPLSWAAA